MVFLSIPQKTKLITWLGDIGRLLHEDPRKYTFDDLDEVLTMLGGLGYKIVPSDSSPAIVQPQASPSKVSPRDLHWLEANLIPAYQSFKKQNMSGYVFKNDVMGKVLGIVCELTEIPFKK